MPLACRPLDGERHFDLACIPDMNRLFEFLGQDAYCAESLPKICAREGCYWHRAWGSLRRSLQFNSASHSRNAKAKHSMKSVALRARFYCPSKPATPYGKFHLRRRVPSILLARNMGGGVAKW